jgi:predicted transcriptional regulator
MSPGTEKLLERVKSWPEEDQEELAEFAREIESRRSGIYRLSDQERTAVRAGMDAARRGDFASEEEMNEFYLLHSRA